MGLGRDPLVLAVGPFGVNSRGSMLFNDKSKRHQYLTQYLRHAARRRMPNDQTAVVIPLGAATLAFLLIGTTLSVPALIIASLGLVTAGWYAFKLKKRREPTAYERLMMEAQPVIQAMLRHADQRRLHRELDDASISVLDECARHYWQVQTVFQSTFWNSATLPVSYHGIRDNALKAADMTMDELMLLYQNSIPENVQGNKPMEFVQDALEEFVFKKPISQDFLPATFEPTRQIAEKMRELSVAADRVSQQLVGEPHVPSITNPGSSLDASLGELRQIAQAEEELRQNLSG